MRRLFDLLTLMLISVMFAQCGGGGDATTAVAVASVRLTPTAVGLGVGQTTVLTAEALAADGAVLVGKTFVFGSSNAAVATVSVAGAGASTATLRGVAIGSTTVTATADGKTGATGVTVTGAALDNIPVAGRVVDGQTQAGIAGAVVAYQTDNGQSGSVASGGDGSFSFAFAGDARTGAYVVEAMASAAGYVTTTLGGAQVRPIGNQIETILLVRQSAAFDGTISGQVLDVRNGNAIAGASLQLERGQGSTTGGSAASASSDAQGRYTFTGLAAGTYTVIASANGFTSGARTAITLPASGTVRRQDIGLSPVGSAPEVRIVLNWGSAPADLDAHLTGPNAAGTTGRFHTYFLNRLAPGAAPFAGIDRDDQDGQGPETITITRFNGGVYRFSVHDYSNRSSAPTAELGRSGATVQVIAGARTFTYHVPVKPGNLWTVFEMTGDIANPTLTERGEMDMAPDFNAIP